MKRTRIVGEVWISEQFGGIECRGVFPRFGVEVGRVFNENGIDELLKGSGYRAALTVKPVHGEAPACVEWQTIGEYGFVAH